MGKTGSKNAQINVHCAQFSGHRDLDASFMVNGGQLEGKNSWLTVRFVFCICISIDDI